MAREAGQPWPVSAQWSDDGELHLSAVGTASLAETYGTPLFVLDEPEFRSRARMFREEFNSAFRRHGMGVDVYYAGKALLTVGVARWAHQEGLRVDTASEGELAVALRAGVPGVDIGLHGNNKSRSALLAALNAQVGRIIVDSLSEITMLAALAQERGVVAPVMVRVTTGVHAGGHSFIATAHEDQKFGLSLTQGLGDDGTTQALSPAMTALHAVIAEPSLQLLGVHSHIGSQIVDASGFVEAARRVLELRAEFAALTGYMMPEVDLGGGYGIPYLPDDQVLDLPGLAQVLATEVATQCAALATAPPQVSIEPGRAIVGPAGVTIYQVGTVKPVTVTGEDGVPFRRVYVSVDGGMADNIRPILYGARYHVVLASRHSTADPVLTRVVGHHCESGDVLIDEVMLPSDIRAGDLLAVAVTGAYGRSMASNYNMMPRPGLVAVADGQAREFLRRETIADLLALDVG